MSALGMCPATLLADPMGAPSELEVRAAVEAALAAGFTDLLVWALHLHAIGDPEALGARIAAVEAATVWAIADRDAATSEAHQLVELAAEHGAGTITAATMAPGIPDLCRARDNMAILVDAAGGRYQRVRRVPAVERHPELGGGLRAGRAARAERRHPSRHVALAASARWA